MSLLTEASLIVTPNAYNVGKLYSVIPNTTLGDMDVSRGSSATRVNSAGLIEIARTNLLTYSNTFSDASWTRSSCSITPNNTTSPDGSVNASKLTSNATNNNFLFKAVTTANGIYTFSCFVKYFDTNTINISLTDFVAGQTFGTFNFSSGTFTAVVTSGAWTNTSTNVITLANGWFKISITSQKNAGTVVSSRIDTFADTTSVYIYGAQLEAGETATSYIPTIASIRTKFAGITQDGSVAQNIPRIDYTGGGCPSILSEPARTNDVLYSEQFDNVYWNKSNVTVTPNTTTAPDGTMTADNLNITAISGYLRRVGLTFANSTSYTISIFVKKSATTGTKNFQFYYNNNVGSPTSSSFACLVDLTNITATTTTSGTIPPTILSTKLVNYGNNWYRVEVAFTTSALGGSSNSEIGLQPPSGGPVVDLDAWGAQVEAGLNATSYIPTTTIPLTRTADSSNTTGLSSLIGQLEGTIYAEILVKQITQDYLICALSLTGQSVLNSVVLTVNNIGKLVAQVYASNVSIVNPTAFVVGDIYKVAFGYKSGNSVLFVNGGQVSITDTDVFNLTTLNAVSLVNSGYYVTGGQQAVKSLVLFKTRLTDPQLANLTAI